MLVFCCFQRLCTEVLRHVSGSEWRLECVRECCRRVRQ